LKAGASGVNSVWIHTHGTGYSATYSYDANGNRLTRTVNSVTEDYVDDDADKLTEVKIGGTPVKTYGYDAAGRTTSVVSGAGTTTLAYDYEGRISQITYPSTATNTFAYNGLDTRVSKVDSAGTSTFLRDGAYVTGPVLSDGLAGYTPGISERRGSTSTFVHGGLKNLDAQTSSSEVVAAERTYDAFGNVVGSSGAWSGPFGYAGGFGYQEDADSGLKLLGHRYYDPSTGRFLTRDPIKDGRNWYSYGAGLGAPTFIADPNGLQTSTVGPNAALAVKILKELRGELVEAVAGEIVKEGLYIIFHDGKYYVGQSSDVDKRLKDHRARFGTSVDSAKRIPLPGSSKDGLPPESEDSLR
jgi:RHS repeat-associated protein